MIVLLSLYYYHQDMLCVYFITGAPSRFVRDACCLVNEVPSSACASSRTGWASATILQASTKTGKPL